MKYYKIKVSNYNQDKRFWVCRSGTHNNCGFIPRIAYESRAITISEDALNNSDLLRYYLSYVEYELVETPIELEKRDYMIYNTPDDFDKFIEDYDIGIDISLSEWLEKISYLNYFKLYIPNNKWVTFGLWKELHIDDNFDNGIIVSDIILYNKNFLNTVSQWNYQCVPVKKPWHFSRIYYDDHDI